jgi:hypothetical protein
MDVLNGSDTMEPEMVAAEETSSPQPEKSRAKTKKKAPPPKRQTIQSTIQFPYRDLETGISVAKAMWDAGGVSLTTEQLAGVMGLQAGSGNFVMKTATARIFGLVTYAGGKYDLTNLGFMVVDRDDRNQKQARAEAFLTVPLYKRTYEEFRGKQLPPRPFGLEQAFVRFGVSAKQKETARQIFEKSATQAGFFASGPDRLIPPIIASGGGFPPPSNLPPDDRGGGGKQQPEDTSEPDTRGLPPFVQVLLDALPEPGTNWAIEGRAKWLVAASNMFDLIYKGAGEITVTAKTEKE